MSIVKPQNFSAIKNEQHNPRAVAAVDMKNGYAVSIAYVDGKEVASIPTAEAAKKDIYFVWNTITTPELDNKDDFVIKAGKPVRAFRFASMNGEVVEISGDLVTGDSVAAGNTLVAGTNGGYVKTNDASTYKISLTVVGKSTVGGTGWECVVNVADFTE